MSPPPLGELYELLRADGFEIGTGDHVRVGRLLAVEGAWTVETLRVAIASLIVKDERDRPRFDACWTRWLAATTATPPPTVEPTPSPLAAVQPVRDARYLPWLGLAGALAIVAVAAWWLWSPRAPSTAAPPDAALATVATEVPVDAAVAPSPTPRDAAAVRPAAPSDAAPAVGSASRPPVDPELADDRAVLIVPPPSSTTPAWIPVGAAIAAALFAILAIVLRRRWSQRERAFVPGPWRYSLRVPIAARPVLPRAAVDDAAGDMTWQSDTAGGHELDLARTVERTVAAGGLPTLVYRPPPAAPEYIVLEDVSRGSARYRFVYDELWRSLAREGVRLARYTYDADLDRCSSSDGKPVVLRDLLEHADAMIVVGDGAGAVDPITGDAAEWLSSLRTIPRRLWIHPQPPSQWSAAARAIARDTPMEHGAARALAVLRAGAARREHPTHPLPAIATRAPASDTGYAALRAHLGATAFTLQAAIAVAGAPSIVAARWLAERLELELDEREWLALANLPWFETERWPDGLQRRLAATLTAADADLAARVANLADAILVASEPAAGTGAHLTWELDVASRRIERGDRAGLVAAAKLASSPLADEVRRRLGALGATDRRRPFFRGLAAAALALVAYGVAAATEPVAVAVPPRLVAPVEQPFLPQYEELAGTQGTQRVFIDRIVTSSRTADATQLEIDVSSYDAAARGPLEARTWQISSGTEVLDTRMHETARGATFTAIVPASTLPRQLAVAAVDPARALTVTSAWRTVPAPPPRERIPSLLRFAIQIGGLAASAFALSQLLLALFALRSPRLRRGIVIAYIAVLVGLAVARLATPSTSTPPADVPVVEDPLVALSVVAPPTDDPTGPPQIRARIYDLDRPTTPSAIILRDLATGATARAREIVAIDQAEPLAIAVVMHDAPLFVGNSYDADPLAEDLLGELAKALDTLSQLGPDSSEGLLVTYGDRIAVPVPLGPLRELTGARLGKQSDYRGRDGNDMVGGITRAIELLEQSRATRKIVIVVGNGTDTNAEAAWKQLRTLKQRATAAKIERYAVAYKNRFADSSMPIMAFAPGTTETSFTGLPTAFDTIVDRISQPFDAVFPGDAFAWDATRHELAVEVGAERLPPITLRLWPRWQAHRVSLATVALLGASALVLVGLGIMARRRRAIAILAWGAALACLAAIAWLVAQPAPDTQVTPFSEVATAPLEIRSLDSVESGTRIERVRVTVPFRRQSYREVALVDLDSTLRVEPAAFTSFADGEASLALAIVVAGNANLLGNNEEAPDSDEDDPYIHGGIHRRLQALLDRVAKLGPTSSTGILVATTATGPEIQFRGPLDRLTGNALGAQRSFRDAQPSLAPAIAKGLEELEQTGAAHRLLVVVSDGEDPDPAARTQLAALRKRALANGIVVGALVHKGPGSTAANPIYSFAPRPLFASNDLDRDFDAIAGPIVDRFFVDFPAHPLVRDERPHRYAVLLDHALYATQPFVAHARATFPLGPRTFGAVAAFALVLAIVLRRRRIAVAVLVAVAFGCAGLAWLTRDRSGIVETRTVDPSLPAPDAAPRLGADIVLAVDISPSMATDDLAPTRIAATQAALRTLVTARPADRFALVTYANPAQIEVPLADDPADLLAKLAALREESSALRGGGGTSIDAAIARGTEAFRDSLSTTRPLAIVVVADSTEDAVTDRIRGAIELHKLAGIAIFPIFVGGGIGDTTPYNTLATMTGGTLYRAVDAATLASAITDLGPKLDALPERGTTSAIVLAPPAITYEADAGVPVDAAVLVPKRAVDAAVPADAAAPPPPVTRAYVQIGTLSRDKLVDTAARRTIAAQLDARSKLTRSWAGGEFPRNAADARRELAARGLAGFEISGSITDEARTADPRSTTVTVECKVTFMIAKLPSRDILANANSGASIPDVLPDQLATARQDCAAAATSSATNVAIKTIEQQLKPQILDE